MGNEPRTDRDLVVAYQGGEVAAFEEIDRRYRPVAERVCSRILFDRGDIEDAVQDTMLAVYRRLPTFNGQYLLGAYVARVATNRALDLIRYKKRRPQMPLTEALVETIEGTEDPVERVLVLDDAANVGRVLGEIPPNHARALELRAHDASHEEIAKDLDLTPPKAKALLHRARGTFRQAWLARLSAIVAAIGAALRRDGGLANAPATGAPMANAAGAAATTGSSQLVASVTSLSANAAPLVNAAIAAEPVVQTASRVVATTAAAVLTIGSAGAGVMLSRPEAPAESFVAPRPAVSESYVPSETPPPSGTTVEPSESAAASDTPSASPSETGSPAEPAPSHTEPAPSEPAQPSPAPEPQPTRTEPTHEPNPSPDPQPAPFRGEFRSDQTTGNRCRCPVDTELRSSDTSGSPSGRFLATWVLSGGLQDSTGDAAWAHDSVLTFDVEGGTGSGTLSVQVSGDETWAYTIDLGLLERQDGSGSSVLRFQGTFSNPDGPLGTGTATVEARVAPDGRALELHVHFRTT